MGITVKGKSLPSPDLVVITQGDIDRAIASSGQMRSYLKAIVRGNKLKQQNTETTDGNSS